MKDSVIPDKNIGELETADYHDGDLDLGVWKEEIPVLIEDAESGEERPAK